jgi:Leucine-rich repeat (LRR) protein
LDLHRNQISDVGAKALAGVIKGAKNLQLLILTANRLTDEGVLALAHAAEGRCLCLRPLP